MTYPESPDYQTYNPAAGGYPQNQPRQEQPTPTANDPWARSNLVAGILALVLGVFGAHRFYLGYTGVGVAMILVCIFTAGIGIVWPIVEGLMILSGAEHFRRDATGRPLRP